MDIVNGFIHIVNGIYEFLWGDLIAIPLPGGGTVGISLLVLLLIPAGIFFTVRLRFPQIRLFPDMIRAVTEKNDHSVKGSISGFQTLIIATATRVGMGNLVGVVAAISAGGAGAVFWMWITAILGSATAFVEATLAQLYREKDPLYGGFRGTPAYYIQDCFGRKGKKSIIAVLFAISGLICWCGISQVISNSVSSAFENAFHIPALYTTIVLVILAAVIVLRKNATVKVLDILVPIMATCYFAITLFIIFKNVTLLPSVFARIFEEAFGIRQAVAGGFGAILMNGVKRGLFSNEAGMGSTPHAHAQANVKEPHEQGCVAMIGVFIDTFVVLTLNSLIVICTLYTPDGPLAAGYTGEIVNVLNNTNLAQTAFGVVFGADLGAKFVAVALFFFAFSTILSWNMFGKVNTEYLFGKKGVTVYTIISLIFIFLGTTTSSDLVWALSDMFNQLMVLPNVIGLVGCTALVVSLTKFKK